MIKENSLLKGQSIENIAENKEQIKALIQQESNRLKKYRKR